LGAYPYGKKDSLVGEDRIYGELFRDERDWRKRYREFVKRTMYDVAVVKYKEGLESLKCPRSILSKTNWRQTFHPKKRF